MNVISLQNTTNIVIMDHIVYLNHKAKELENLKNGIKTKIIRGATGRKLPYNKVNIGDVLYFIENNGSGIVQAKAVVSDVYNSPQLSAEESINLVELNQPYLKLDSSLMTRFAGKRYIVLITISNFEAVKPFAIDKTQYSNMDDWLPVGVINSVSKEL
jgi:hypothetical protein